jgi:hypothetical protein
MNSATPPPLPRSKSQFKTFGLWAGAIVLALFIIGRLSPTPNASVKTAATDTTAAEDMAALRAKDEARRRADPAQCLALQSYKAVSEQYSSFITGAVKNSCGRTFRYVQITWKLFDGSGAVVGTALANQNNLDDGEVWKFKAHAFGDFAKYRLDKITAF